MTLIPTKGQNVTISACEEGRVRQMVATLEANEKVKKTRGHALAKAGRTRSRGNEVPECSTQAASMGGRRSHFISSSGCAKPKTLNSRKHVSTILLSLSWVVFLGLVQVTDIERKAICPALHGCSRYQGDDGGREEIGSFRSSCNRSVSQPVLQHQAPYPLTCGPCGVGGVWLHLYCS